MAAKKYVMVPFERFQRLLALEKKSADDINSQPDATPSEEEVSASASSHPTADVKSDVSFSQHSPGVGTIRNLQREEHSPGDAAVQATARQQQSLGGAAVEEPLETQQSPRIQQGAGEDRPSRHPPGIPARKWLIWR